MEKQILIDLINSEIDNKKLVLTNTMTDEDKTVVQNQIDNLQAMLEKVSEMEGDNTAEIIDELKNTVNELNDKLTALNEKIQQNNNEDNKEEEQMNNEYLKTTNAVHDFCEVIRNSKNGEEFKAGWKAMLIKNDAEYSDTVTIAAGSEESFLPELIKGRLTDIWNRNADWLNSLNFTGAKRFACRANTSEQDAETSRAKGHKKGDKKVAQKLNFAAKVLDAQFLYKIATLSYETIWSSDQDLLDYILDELTTQILYEVKRAILVGDGRDVDDPYKINKIEAIYKDTTDAYTTVVTVGDANTGYLIDDLRLMCDQIHNPNNRETFAFMNKATLRTLSRVQASSTSTPVFMSREQVAEQMGVTRIIDTDLLADNECIAMIPSEYYMVGANILDPVFYSWHDGWTNEDNWREEIVVGGGINGLKSTAVLKAE